MKLASSLKSFCLVSSLLASAPAFSDVLAQPDLIDDTCTRNESVRTFFGKYSTQGRTEYYALSMDRASAFGLDRTKDLCTQTFKFFVPIGYRVVLRKISGEGEFYNYDRTATNTYYQVTGSYNTNDSYVQAYKVGNGDSNPTTSAFLFDTGFSTNKFGNKDPLCGEDVELTARHVFNPLNSQFTSLKVNRFAFYIDAQPCS